MSSTIYPLLDKNKLPTAYISVRTDITDRMQFSEALQETNIDLQLAREQAEAANLAKSTFLANMSHEIRTPLNSIIGLAQVALIDAKESKQTEYLQYILGSGNHLLGLINDILDISRIEAGKLSIDTRSFSFKQVIDILSSMLLHQANSKKLELVFEVDKNIPAHLHGDPMRLAQILINYTGNAIKFTDAGKIIVRAKVQEESASHCMLYCEVQDYGKGISAADQTKLFQVFEQLDTSDTRIYGGSGLGLAISKNMAQLMGGEVGVISQTGSGSTFWFTACLEKGEWVDARDSSEVMPSQAAALSALVDAKILLVDDNVFNQEVLTASLSKKGAHITVAQNGQDALNILRGQIFDCILMDMQMPVMNGVETTRNIRANPALSKLPIIAMTASARNEDKQSCLLAGMDDYLSKPIILEKLYAILGKWLPNRLASLQTTELPADISPAPAPAQAQAAFDLTELSNLLENDHALVRKHAVRFLQTAKESIAEMELALTQGNAEALNALGHRTYSSARMVGAHGFANACQTLEFLDVRTNAAEAMRLIERLKLTLNQIITEIESKLTC